jgi:chromate transporter
LTESKTEKHLWQIFWVFFKIGFFTFGGGYAMISIIEKKVVEEQHWIKSEDIVDVFALSQAMPGAIAINSATIIGYQIAGLPGAIVATLGSIIPSIITIALIAKFFVNFLDIEIVKAAFMGVRAGIVALVLKSGIKIAKASVTDKITLLICCLTIISVAFFSLNPIGIIILGALFGLLLYRIYPKKAKEILEGHKQ